MNWLVRILIVLLLAMPVDGYCQKRQRAKNKTKTTAVTKKNTNKKSGPTTSAEARKKQQEAQKEIKLTEAQIKENEQKVSKSLTELGKVDQQIEQTSAKIKELDVTLKRLDGEIGGLEKSINKNESELAKLRDEYLKAVKRMRVTKKNRSSLAYIFSSKSLSEANRRMRYLKEFSSWRNRQTVEINGKIEELNKEKESLASAREEKQQSLIIQQRTEATLSSQKGRQEKLIAELKQNGKALESHLKKKQAEAKELGNMVSQLIAEEQRKAAEEEARRKAEEAEERRLAEEKARKEAEEAKLLASKEKKEETKKSEKAKKEDKKIDKKAEKKGEYAEARKREARGKKEEPTPNTASNNGSFETMRGKLPTPTTGSFVVTSRFGRQHLPDLPDVEYDNPGIDAESDAGASACAVFKGKVSGVYLLPGYNTVVIVNHGNYYTVYGNIASASVKTGDAVDVGKTLGKLALDDEDKSRSNIHFEVWKNREKLNPQEWLK